VFIPEARIVSIPGDGNCMFTAYNIAVSMSLGKLADALPSRDTMAAWGQKCVRIFLTKVRAAWRKPGQDFLVSEISLATILLDVADIDAAERALPPNTWPEAKQYLHKMQFLNILNNISFFINIDKGCAWFKKGNLL
jgi:hypothetical protein